MLKEIPQARAMYPNLLQLFSSEIIALHQINLAEVDCFSLTYVDAGSDHQMIVLGNSVVCVRRARVSQRANTIKQTQATILYGKPSK